MAGLTGQTPKDSYDQILIVDNEGGGSTTALLPIKDGDGGTTFALSVASNKLATTALSKFYFDGGDDTYMHESASNTIGFVTNDNTILDLSTSATVYSNLGVQRTGTDADISIRSDGNNKQRILFMNGSDNIWGVYHEADAHSGSLIFEDLSGTGGKMRLQKDGQLYLYQIDC